MALCTSCGSDVDDAASFCTSCGQRMTSSNAGATITVTRPSCSACGAQVNLGSVFCTNCGQRMAQPAVIEETAPSPGQAEPESIVATAVAPPLAVEAPTTPAAPSSSRTVCRSCGAKLEPGTGFCTICGQPTSASDTITSSATSVVPAVQATTAIQSVSAEPAKAPFVAETAFVPPPVAVPEDAVMQPAPPTASPQIALPIHATPADYSPLQPGGGAFRRVMLILLLVIVVGAFGGWYFWGVETVIVCSPPDVRVFLDDNELTPASYGRYVIPHLSRQSHLLKVQRPGFADTIQRLDFSLTSLHEWVNIKLVPSRKLR